MATGTDGLSDREERLQDALLAYFEAVEQGPAPDRQEWFDRYPEFAAELAVFFAGRDQVELLAGPLRAVLGAQAEETVDAGPAPDRGDSSNLPLPGTRVRYFGNYELLGAIGQGGNGVVYAARQRNLNRVVALKMILAGRLASEAERQRFHNEAEAVAGLDHPHIVPIYEHGEHDGYPYFSMKLVGGGSLARHMAACGEPSAAGLPPREAARLLATVARAVHYGHQHGILHRDLKPQNILVDAQGQPYVTDFGLARRIGADSALTQTGAMVGTPSYMAPEQATGQNAAITTATDVYGLGAILYALLTGRPPFKGATPLETLEQVKQREPEPPSQSHPGVDRDLETISLKCLQKDPQRRYGSAEALAQDLERWLNGEPILARPIGVPARAWRWCRRHPAVAGLTATAIALLLTTVAVLAVSNVRITRATGLKEAALKQAKTNEQAANAQAKLARVNANRAETQRKLAVEQEQIARAQKARAEAGERSIHRHLRAAQMHLAQQAEEMGHAQRAVELLEAQRPIFGQEDLRGFEWFHLWRRYHAGLLFTLEGHLSLVTSVAFSPDGTILATGSNDRTVKLWDVATGQEQATLREHDGPVGRVAFAPDGKTLAVASKDLILWDVSTRQKRATLKRQANAMFYTESMAFSPDGQTLVWGSLENVEVTISERSRSIRTGPSSRWTVQSWDVATGQERPFLKGDNGHISYLAWAPDGKTLAGAVARNVTGTDAVLLWDAVTKQEKASLAPKPANPESPTSYSSERGPELVMVNCLGFAPDGQTLATGGRLGTVRLWDVATQQERATLRGHRGDVHAVAFAPDGKSLASGCSDGTVRVWDLATGEARTVAHGGMVLSVNFTPDGKTLASGSTDGTAKLWDMTTGQEPALLAGHAQRIRDLAFSSDGKTLASVGMDRTVRLWDVAAGESRGVLQASPPKRFDSPAVVNYTAAVFSADGKTVEILGRSMGGIWTVTLWDVATGQVQTPPGEPSREPQPVAFSPDGRTLAWGEGFTRNGPDDALTLRDAATGHVRATLKWQRQPFAKGLMALAFAPDGKALATAVPLKVTVWDVTTGRERFTIRGHMFTKLAFAPDGQTLALMGGDTVEVRDVATGHVRTSFKGRQFNTVRSLVLAPDGQNLATTSGDETVKFWDVVTGQERATLPVDPSGVTALAFTPDGQTLATGTGNGMVKLWHAATEREVVAGLKGEAGPQRYQFYVQRAAAFQRSRDYDLALDELNKALVLDRTGPEVENDLAWLLATCPSPTLRDPRRAQELAQKAVEAAPERGEYWNTLGVADYRAGDWKAAVEALEKSMRLRRGGDSSDWFFLAMASWQRGVKDEARKQYDQAVQWMETNRPDDDELRRFRAEAAELLGLKVQPPGNAK
jgi:WD40 repeat protein/tRNA A-37 threonylcarbamoyl transferase component Bud32